MSQPVLEVRNLEVEFVSPHADRPPLRTLRGVSLDIAAGEILGLVGESGAGKSLTGAAVLRLLAAGGRISAGEIYFAGQRIDRLPESQIRPLRGARIGAVFQDPMTALDPLMTVGEQLVETIRTHRRLSREQARDQAVALLDSVGVPAASRRLSQYPHQFSGGMRQRVVLALAMAGEPDLLIADEPTTALDVSVQAQVLAVFRDLCDTRGTAVMLVTHDMGVVAEICDRVGVMYAGRIVEIGTVDDVLGRPAHPYTEGLLRSIPALEAPREQRLWQIPGAMPRPVAVPAGCAYHPRCPRARDVCRNGEAPPLGGAIANVACHFPTRFDQSITPLERQTMSGSRS